MKVSCRQLTLLQMSLINFSICQKTRGEYNLFVEMNVLLINKALHDNMKLLFLITILVASDVK